LRPGDELTVLRWPALHGEVLSFILQPSTLSGS
jgi:hypothetical protein